ncbi:MAG: cytochrome c oxidase subunit 3 [Terriglobales bacterium]
MAVNPPLLTRPARMPRLRRAVWLAMAAMTMFFLALTYAYLQRHGLTTGWLTPQLATILSANTAILLASSVALQRAREFLRARAIAGVLRWMGTAFGLGLAFLGGQALAWRTLLDAGVYIARRPNSAFFYLVTAAHAVHLSLALALLGWVLTRAWRGLLVPDRPLLLDVTAIVWHCLDITWVYLYCVLLLYR